jgi:hypothetical protein
VGSLAGSPQLGRELAENLWAGDKLVVLCMTLISSSSSRSFTSARLRLNTPDTAWLIPTMARRYAEPWPTWPVAVS